VIDDDKTLDASKAGAVEDSNGYDFVVNTFVQPGEKRDVRAMDVNTVDDLPDSSWFTNRIGQRTMSIDEIVRGPDSRPSVSLDGWVVTAGKSAGVQPGFRVKDPKDPSGQLYQSNSIRRRIPRWRAAPRSSAPRSTTRSGITRSRSTSRNWIPRDHHRARREGLRPVDRREARLTSARPRQGLSPRRAPGERQVPGAGEPLRHRQTARQLPLLRHPSR
jgi:hypothetical protein